VALKTLAVIAAITTAVIAVGSIAYWLYYSKGSRLVCLVVGTSPDFPPFVYMARNGSIVGFDIELIKILASKAGYKCIKIKVMPFDSLVPALKQGQIDVIAAGITITPEKAKEVDFTKPYWHWNVDQAILVKVNSRFKPKTIRDLSNRTIGIGIGSAAINYLKEVSEKESLNIKIKEYSSYALAVQDLLNSRIDAIVVDVSIAKTFVKQYKGKLEISMLIRIGEKYGFAVRKGDRELLDKLNKALEEVRNSPLWGKLVQKYFGSASPPYT